MAAEQGDAQAQFNLGVAYNNGDGVSKNYKQAIKWYRLSASQGLGVAQYNLGNMYANGIGIPEDKVLAYMWWNLALGNGLEDIASANMEHISQEMNYSQIVEAKKLSQECLKKNYRNC